MSNPKKKQRYDQYGDQGDDDLACFSTDQWLDAYEYYRAMFPEITKEDFKSFEERYRGSAEEEQDLLEFYEDNEGDLTSILESIMVSRNEDVERFIKFFEAKIKSGELEKTALFDKTKKKIKLLPDEKQEAKKMKKDLKKQKENK